MENNKCTSEKFSKYFLSSLFGLFSLGLVVLGFTLLPIIGFVLALPVVAISIILIRTRLNDQCELDFNTDVS
ncbi:hypothetical protein [Desulfobacter curvatus]|uniref:hypothetical protein n=1 Tax=Desulfobacter curvatus TaxID=2290 RepID=UPI0003667B5E|nr:hypothetical protein [Desulfobacter curvatus]